MEKADYSTLIDAETWTFIEQTNAWYPPETVEFPVAKQREIYDAMCREFFSGYPKGVAAETTAINGLTGSIPIRIYRKEACDPIAQILYFHGGGFVVGGLESHDDVCAELCDRTGFRVTSVDYRLAPEFVHPASFDDALAAFRWMARSDLPIVLAGDSAGGNLAAAVSHATRSDSVTPKGQVLIYPSLGGDMTGGSYVVHAEAPMLSMQDLIFYRDIRSNGSDLTADPTAFPLADDDFTNLPPTVVVTAECDPLSDDGPAYCDVVIAAGGKAVCFEESGLVHGYLRARHRVGRAGASFTRIVEAIAALGKGEWRAVS